MATKNRNKCFICPNIDISDDPNHKGSENHFFNFIIWQWHRYKKALVKDRHGIVLKIAPDLVNNLKYSKIDFNVRKGRYLFQIFPLQMLRHSNKIEFSCTVKNTRKDKILLMNAILLFPSSKKYYSMYDPQMNMDKGKVLLLDPGCVYTMKIVFELDEIVVSSFKVTASFQFQTYVEENSVEKPDTFSIARSLIVDITEEIETVEVVESPFKMTEWVELRKIISATHQNKYSRQFEIPEHFEPFFATNLKSLPPFTEEDNAIVTELQNQMNLEQQYRYCWRNVLWLEEMAEAEDLKRYNMDAIQVSLTTNGKMAVLEVPGLAEKRPSVVQGDYIQMRRHKDHTAYEGLVKRVHDKTIEIAYLDNELLAALKADPDMKLDVRFRLNYLAYERMHQGVIQVYPMKDILFPTLALAKKCVNPTRTLHDREIINKKIANNPEQRMAVYNILNNSSQRAPYIVYGPPGTGKTDTIVEAILQLRNKTKHKILVCAPANAACDNIAVRLIERGKLKKGDLIREHAETVDTSILPKSLLEFSNIDSDGKIVKSTAAEFSKYRIAVTTLILIGRFMNKTELDVVFIDEAAQAREPECDVAIGTVSAGLQLVLAGDPNQLGPSSASRAAKEFGIEKSLLERLMERDLYKTNDQRFITMLKQNYRSHEMILRLPNELFYNGQLQAMSVEAANDPIGKICVYAKLENLHKKLQNCPGKPIEFCAVLSKEQKEGYSPSYFNVKELQMVFKYVKALTSLGNEYNVTADQIGVVTPYIRQVYKIRDNLRKYGFEGVEVGTTETFQGREKRVIIISTVRAQHDLLLYDKKYNLGFVRHEKRFNVAITRAKSKLILIGNPLVLGTDDNWLKMIELCESNNSYYGAPFVRRNADFRADISRKGDKVLRSDSQYMHNKNNQTKNQKKRR